jgi:hypothetical protein
MGLPEIDGHFLDQLTQHLKTRAPAGRETPARRTADLHCDTHSAKHVVLCDALAKTGGDLEINALLKADGVVQEQSDALLVLSYWCSRWQRRTDVRLPTLAATP